MKMARPYFAIMLRSALPLRQAHERGGSVRKGECAAVVVKSGRHQKAVNIGDGVENRRTMFFLKSYRVFNVTQIEGS